MNEKNSVYCGKEVHKYLYLTIGMSILILIGSYLYMGHGGSSNGASAGKKASNIPANSTRQVAPNKSQSLMNIAAVEAAPFMTKVAMSSVQQDAFTSVAHSMMRSVVNVTSVLPGTERTRENKQQRVGAKFADPFTGVTSTSIGSGVLVTKDGYIVTNFHVVEQTENINVSVFHTQGMQRYPAKVIRRDEARDLALLKIDTQQNLTAAPLGESRTLQLGEPVIAIGSPFGLDQSVSKGVISSTRKSLTIEGVVHNGLIQTDAAINQGNSGGPLVDSQGYVVAINTAIYSPTGAFSGIGFAVPVDTVKLFLAELIRLPAVQPNLQMPLQGGIQAAARKTAPPIAANARMPHDDRGACENCHEIMPTGWKARFKFESNQPFTNAIVTGSNAMPASVVAPGNTLTQSGNNSIGNNSIGADLLVLDEALAKRYQSHFTKGVFVQNVVADTVADQAGLKTGDIIFKIEGRWVTTPKQLIRRLKAHKPGEQVRLSITRNNSRQNVYVEIKDQTLNIDQQVMGLNQQNNSQQNNGMQNDYQQNAVQGGTAGNQNRMMAENRQQNRAAGNNMPRQNNAAGRANRGQNPQPAIKPRIKTEFEWNGMELKAVTSRLKAKKPDLKGKYGALVNDNPDPGSPADMAGINRNDLITSINNIPVISAETLDKAIKAADKAMNTSTTATTTDMQKANQGTLLKVDRNGRKMFVTMY